MSEESRMQDVDRGEIVIYQPQAGEPVLQVRLDHETVWLDAHQMAELFGRDRTVILRHVRNIYATQELMPDATCAFFAQVAADGRVRQMDLYNLDMILSVGYRVNSKRGTYRCHENRPREVCHKELASRLARLRFRWYIQ